MENCIFICCLIIMFFVEIGVINITREVSDIGKMLEKIIENDNKNFKEGE